MPHVHLVAYIPFDDLVDHRDPAGNLFEDGYNAITRYIPADPFPGIRGDYKLKIAWSKHGSPCSVPDVAFIARKLWLKQLDKFGLNTPAALIRSVDFEFIRSDNSVHYLCDHETKQKQAQLGWQGRQWGIINGSALVFEESAPKAISGHLQARFARIVARIESNRISDRTKCDKRKALEIFQAIRRQYGCDYVKHRFASSNLVNLRLPVGALPNACNAPTFETMRNYSRIEYRAILRPVCFYTDGKRRVLISPFPGTSFRPSEMSFAQLFEAVGSGTFEPCEDSLIQEHARHLARLRAPLVQSTLDL